MPPRKIKRKKSSATPNASVSIDHELPKIPEFSVIGPNDGAIDEPIAQIPDQAQLSNSSFAQLPDNYVDGDKSQSEPVSVSEIVSAQEEKAAVQVDDFNIVDDNNNPLAVVEDNGNEENEDIEKSRIQESNINESPCKNDDVLVVEGTEEIVSFQESCVNNTTLIVKDVSKESEDDEQSDDDIQGDDANNEEPSVLDDIKDKDIEIHVGKLDKDTVEEDLVQVFQQFGELKSTRIVRKPNTNKSKGFAFIQFATVDQTKRALSELKDGVEVRGKRVTVSASQNNRTLFLGNIHKTWKKEQVLEQLKHYGIEHIETINVPEEPTSAGKIRGFAFLEFTSRLTAGTAFQRLQKPDAVFGRDISAKVAFAQSSTEDLLPVNQVYVGGLSKDWTEEKVEEICKTYGEIVKINLLPSNQTKKKDFGFITFTSPESALACVEGINNIAAIEGETKIKANLAKSNQNNRVKKQRFRGGFKVEKPGEVSNLNKDGEVSNKKSEPKALKMKGVLNTQKTQGNKKDSPKNKNKASTSNKPQKKGLVNSYAEISKEAMKGDSNSQRAPKNKRKASSDQKLNNRDQGTPKKPKSSGAKGKNNKTSIKAGKRKIASGYEAREDRGSGKKPSKKQKGNMYGRGRDDTRNPQNDTGMNRGHDDSRNSARYVVPYVPKYVPSASHAYDLAPDYSLATRRYTDMEPHAGLIEPASANQSRSYSGYAQPAARNPLSQQHQTVYLAPRSATQSYSQSQLYSRYVDRSALNVSHRGYDGTGVIPEVQPYREYLQPAIVQIARDPYESRVVRHDDRGAGVVTYVGGPPVAASVVRDRTSYYQGAGAGAGGSYSGAYYSTRQTY